jgi:hypothetical protein
MTGISKFAHMPTIDRCLDAIARERAKPAERRRYLLMAKWRDEIERAGGYVAEIPRPI